MSLKSHMFFHVSEAIAVLENEVSEAEGANCLRMCTVTEVEAAVKQPALIGSPVIRYIDNVWKRVTTTSTSHSTVDNFFEFGRNCSIDVNCGSRRVDSGILNVCSGRCLTSWLALERWSIKHRLQGVSCVAYRGLTSSSTCPPDVRIGLCQLSNHLWWLLMYPLMTQPRRPEHKHFWTGWRWTARVRQTTNMIAH